MKPSTQARRVLLAASLAGTVAISATGCSSSGIPLASMNPFNSAEPAVGTKPAAKATESIAAKAQGSRNQANTLTATAKNAYAKTKGAVGRVFGQQPDPEASPSGGADDPLRLDNQPGSIGPEVFVANGQLWESTGNFSKAMESYTKALKSEPNNPPALTSIARLHFRQGSNSNAAEYFRKAIQQSPEDASLHHDLGLALEKMNDHAGATAALTRALELAPGTSRYANSLARTRYAAGHPEAAYEVLAENNKPAVAHFNMAYLHFQNGQLSDARGHLAKVIEFEPLAESDSAVKRAVQRSREMLAQIDGPISEIARSRPDAQVAARPASARSASARPAPSAGAPATTGAAPAAAATPAPATPAASTAAPAGAANATVPAGGAAAVNASAAPSGPAIPSGSTSPSGSASPEGAATASDAAGPSLSLPAGFSMPNSP